MLQATLIVCCLVSTLTLTPLAFGQELGEHGYVDSDGVKIHYVTAGEGPLVILIHGFPDYWYSWRHQMPELAKHFKVVAIDQRGYNKSDQPSDVADYAMAKLLGDVRAVIRHFGQDKATIVGHDWGGAVAWYFAIFFPDMTERLVVLNTPHPNGLSRELKDNPEQQKNSQYARDFQQPGAAAKLTAEALADIVADDASREYYLAAFERSSFEGMLNYYKANYPKGSGATSSPPLANVKCRVLMIYGLQDTALLPAGLNNTWEWLDQDLTLVTVPAAGHFVQHDAPQFVTQQLLKWLVYE